MLETARNIRPDYDPITAHRFKLDGEVSSLLTRSNPKTAKGEKIGYLTAILHLAPAGKSGIMNTCPSATDGCASACLNTAGRGGIGMDAAGLNTIQAARIRKTRFFKRDRVAFMAMLEREIALHEKNAKRHGLKSAVRLNGTSDLPFERLTLEDGQTLIDRFPETRFYDYTKWDVRKRQPSSAYHLTFSLAESNERLAGIALEKGINVAVVFATGKNATLPATYEIAGTTVPVVDGDETDLRFLDPIGCIVGLRAKGSAKGSDSGFVRAV